MRISATLTHENSPAPVGCLYNSLGCATPLPSVQQRGTLAALWAGMSKTKRVTFTTEDVSELYHIINNRGHSSTRVKLLNALEVLDPDLARRVKEEDAKAWR